MCLNPRNSITKSRYVNAANVGASIYNTYNCGKCAECKQMKQTEYSLRSQAQYKATIEQGGFCYWDTLTYNQENVPVYSKTEGLTRGFNNHSHYDRHGKLVLNSDCILTFNPEDYRKFLKRLRTNLTRAGYDVGNNLKYFFVSEYGGKTHRPHYHFIFYVTIPELTPELLELYVRKSWKLGRIDEDKVSSKKVIDGFGAINYVAKYVTKDDEYINVLAKYCKKFDVDKATQKEVLQPFHRQSQGFGIDIISQQDKDFMFKTGKMQVWQDTGYVEVEIPLYIKRKLYFENYKDSEGQLHWRLNDYGKDWYMNLLPQKLVKMVDRYIQSYSLASSIIPKDEYSFSITDTIDKLMEGRTFQDLAIYQMFYQGKLLPLTQRTLPTIEEMIDGKFQNDVTDLSELPCLIESHPDISCVVDLQDFYKKVDGGFEDFNGRFIPFDTFLDIYLINEHSFFEFSGFDFVLGLLGIVNREISRQKENKYTNKQNIKARLRTLRNKYNY